MTFAIGEAAAALTLAGTITGTVVELTQPSSSTHWSFYILVGGAACGTVVAVAAVILANYPVVACAAIMAVSNTIGAIYVKRFSIYKDLEFYVSKLSQKVTDLASVLKLLKQSKDGLKQANLDFAQSAKEYEKILHDGNAIFQKEISTVDDLVKKATINQEMLTQWKNLTQEQLQIVREMAANREQLDKENEELRQQLELLDKQSKELVQENAQLKTQVDLLQQTSAQLHQDIGNLQKLSERLAEQEENLEQALSSQPMPVNASAALKKSNENLEKNLRAVDSHNRTVGKLLDQLQERSQTVMPLLHLLMQLNAKEAPTMLPAKQ